MENYRKNIFIIMMSLILLISVIPDVKGILSAGGIIFNVIPLLLDVIVVFMLLFQFKWITQVIIVWSAWQIMNILLLLFGIVFLMLASKSSKLPIFWSALQIIFGVLKIIGICYFVYLFKKLNMRRKETTP